MTSHRLNGIAAGLAATLVLTACGASEEGNTPTVDPTPADPTTSEEVTESGELTVVTHESFALPDELLEQFAEETGLDVTYVQPGNDGGALVNQLILTKDAPLGDVVFGIDNTFATRALREGAISPYDSDALPADSTQFVIDGLTPIDFGDVCINADVEWFEAEGIPLPTTFDDLIDPQYQDLLVVTNPASSSPGLAFMLATVGTMGEDEWLDYWSALNDNGLLVVQSWSDAYYGNFTQAEGGERPLVLSYSTSPAFTASEDGETNSTVALLGTCFRQIEYAGVIEGAQNEAGAQAFVDFLLSEEVQAAIPEYMYMYPAVLDVELPEEWVKFAPLSPNTVFVDPEVIAENRDAWIQDWTDTVLG